MGSSLKMSPGVCFDITVDNQKAWPRGRGSCKNVQNWVTSYCGRPLIKSTSFSPLARTLLYLYWKLRRFSNKKTFNNKNRSRGFGFCRGHQTPVWHCPSGRDNKSESTLRLMLVGHRVDDDQDQRLRLHLYRRQHWCFRSSIRWQLEYLCNTFFWKCLIFGASYLVLLLADTVCFTDLDQGREVLSWFSLPKSMKHTVWKYISI